MVRTVVRTIFYVFRDDIVMAVSQVFPWGITPYLSETQSRRAHIFILLLSYCCNWEEVTSALQTIRWTIEHESRILVVIKLITIERHTGQDFSLFHDKYVLLSRASKVKKEQTHQDEGDDRNVFSEKVNHGGADVPKHNGQEVELLFFPEQIYWLWKKNNTFAKITFEHARSQHNVSCPRHRQTH